MKKVKFVSGFAVFGFVLSFCFGLFSKSGFGHIILVAFIFAFVFAFLGFLLNFIFEKFFDASFDDDDKFASDSKPSSQTGQNIDITIGDQEIPEDANDSQFFVGTNHQLLNESDYTTNGTSSDGKKYKDAEISNESKIDEVPFTSKPDANEANNDSNSAKEKIANENASANVNTENTLQNKSQGFVPINLGETPKNISGTEAKPINEVKSENKVEENDSEKNDKKSSDSDEELDTLPDLEDFSAESQSSNQEADVDDDDDASDISSSSGSISAEDVTEGKDVTLMAKAISTMLEKDK